jgi:hypothetical protein
MNRTLIRQPTAFAVPALDDVVLRAPRGCGHASALRVVTARRPRMVGAGAAYGPAVGLALVDQGSE